MIIKRFLDWVRTASAAARAEAAGALARVYLESALSADEKRHAESALTWLVDDASPLVRRALAEVMAAEPRAPASVMLALAHDQSDIAAIVLARSPVLTDADLVDCAAVGDLVAQTAIALRHRLGEPVAAALAEIGEAGAIIALARNRSARITAAAMMRMVERHGAEAAAREALLARPDLTVEARQAIVATVSRILSAFVVDRNWLRPERGQRLADDAREAATLELHGLDQDADHLVAHLRATGQLTAAFLLRALVALRLPLVTAAFADLSGLPAARVDAILYDGRVSAFRALYNKAGMPASLAAGFEACLTALRECAPEMQGQALSRRMIERALTTLETLPSSENDKLFALLRRFEAEAARSEARAFVADLLPPLRPISELLELSAAQAA